MDQNDVVCNCLNVTVGMIKDAVDSGAKTLVEVQEITQAGTICDACLEDVEDLVEKFVSEKNS